MTTTSQIASNTSSTQNTFNSERGDVGGNDQISTAKEFNGNENTQNCGSVISTNSSANNLRGADGKRKKLKSRNIPTTSNTSYSKDHLDAWLETCLKDMSQEQLSSSSEFLDYNPTMITATNSNASKQKHSQVSSSSVANSNASKQNFAQAIPGQQHQQQQISQSNLANTRTNAKANSFMPGFPTGYSAPFSQGFQRSMPNFMKLSPNAYGTNRFSTIFTPSTGGFYGPHNDNSQDFASLPPIVNLLGNYGGNGGAGNGAGSSEHENNSTDVLDGSGSNPNMSRGFRFSDPCLLNPSDNDSKISGHNTPDRRQNMPNEMENNKFFVALMEQINILHETNSKICRNLHETKVDIEALKHAPTWGMRHRRDSVSGLSTHSQPMIFGGGFGTQSPAPTYHSGAYTPGIMTDVVREVKEAARVREDAMLNRVKALVEERQWTMNETNLRMMRDIEELKSQINFLRSDRKEANKRITHLEAENKYMRQLLASIYNSNRNFQLSGRDTIYEHEAQRSRARTHSQHSQHPQHPQTPNTHTRRAQSLNLHYGTIHHQASSTLSLEEQEEEPLHIVETPTMPTTNVAELKQQKFKQQQVGEQRNSFSSSDGSNGLASAENASIKPLAMSPPKFALVSTPTATDQQPLQKPKRKNKENALRKLSSEESLKQQQKQEQQKEIPQHQSEESITNLDAQDLQRELSDAVAARQSANDRIIAIEKLVRNLHVNATHPNDTFVLENGDGKLVHNNPMFTSGPGVNQTNATTILSSKLHMHHHSRSEQQTMVTNLLTPTSKLPQQQNVSNASNLSTALLQSPKLSVAGPITDL